MASPQSGWGGTQAPSGGGGSASGWGGTSAPVSAAPAKGGGGILGAVEHTLGGGAHWIASKADLAAHDIKAIPGGVVKQAIDVATVPGGWHTAGQQWIDLLHGNLHWAPGDPLRQDIAAQAKGALTSVEHPGRDPFQTAFTVGALAAPVAGGVARVGYIGEALDAAKAAETAGDTATASSLRGAAVRAAVSPLHKPPVTPRTLQVPRTVAPAEGAVGPARLVHEPVQLQASGAPLARGIQAAHDVVVQRALTRNFGRAEPSPLGRYARSRVAKSVAETGRIQQNLRNVPVTQLERAGAGRHAFDKGVGQKPGQLALFLHSANVLPHEAASFWHGQEARGINAAETGRFAKLAETVGQKGLLHLGADGNVDVSAGFPKLAAVKDLMAEAQATREGIIREHGIMDPAALQKRLDLVGRRIAGATYVKPTPGRLGVASSALIRQRAYVARLEQLHGRALGKTTGAAAARAAPGEAAIGTRIVGPGRVAAAPGAARVERLGGALSVARDRLEQMEAAAARRQEPTGIVGGETARPGQGYTPLATQVKARLPGRVATTVSSVVGKPRSPVGAQAATGEGVAAGLIPESTTAGVARALRDALKFVNTTDYRARVVRYGSDTKAGGDHVLVRDPASETAGKLSPAVEQAVGRTESTLNTLPEEEHQRLATTLRQHVEDAIPGLRDNFAANRAAGIGTRADPGYKWVPKRLLGDTVASVGEKTAVGAKFDAINRAITAATVYFKVGHLATRTVTNAATSILSGAASPGAMRASAQLWEQLTMKERLQALAATGTHGMMALPHEGVGRVARAASYGAGWWARRIDAPFRFANLAHEARQAGFTTADEFRQMLKAATDPASSGLSAADAAKADWVLKRANRVSIMYDGLSPTEQKYIARAFWFYPWFKGATRYGGHVLMEHPVTSAALGAAGRLGAQQQQQQIGGPLPSWAYGLMPISGGRVSDLGMMGPFGTPADALGMIARPGEISGQLNPVLGAALTAATGINQYGSKTKTPLGDAIAELFSPTPEAQIASAYLHPHGPQAVFHPTALSALARALAGPELPRAASYAALRSSGARQLAGR